MDVPRLNTFENTKKSFIQQCVSILYISNIRKNSCFFDEYIFSQEKKVELGPFLPYIVTPYHLSYLSESLNKWNFWKVWNLSFPKPCRLSSYDF